LHVNQREDQVSSKKMIGVNNSLSQIAIIQLVLLSSCLRFLGIGIFTYLDLIPSVWNGDQTINMELKT
jgi:hypothetical protein